MCHSPSTGQLVDEEEPPATLISRSLWKDARDVEPFARVDDREAHCFGLNVDSEADHVIGIESRM